ncbi:CHRD domain-containing protein [Paraflavisolibacter sp. H34]|uniref:CHRD domain-containing protein n=1 Tax=Huijunlia imazamoxiresistens TaxID=3127457 RepID=UPI0030190923
MTQSESLRWVKFFLWAGILALAASGCKDDKDDNQYMLSGAGSGAQEVPAVTTPAAATLTGSYDKDANKLTYTISWTNLKDSVTLMHFHGPAMPGQSAPPLIDILPATKDKNGSTSGTAILVDSVENHLLAGKLYYNIHTKVHGAGEVRGQVSATR